MYESEASYQAAIEHFGRQGFELSEKAQLCVDVALENIREDTIEKGMRELKIFIESDGWEVDFDDYSLPGDNRGRFTVRDGKPKITIQTAGMSYDSVLRELTHEYIWGELCREALEKDGPDEQYAHIASKTKDYLLADFHVGKVLNSDSVMLWKLQSLEHHELLTEQQRFESAKEFIERHT